MATCDANELVELANCFSCLMPYQLELVKTVLLCQLANPNAVNPMANCDVQALMSDASCFSCLTSFQLSVIQTQLLCEILNGGGSGAACIECGAAAPVDPAGCDCSLYYNTTTASMYYWDSALAQWVLLLGPP